MIGLGRAALRVRYSLLHSPLNSYICDMNSRCASRLFYLHAERPPENQIGLEHAHCSNTLSL